MFGNIALCDAIIATPDRPQREAEINPQSPLNGDHYIGHNDEVMISSRGVSRMESDCVHCMLSRVCVDFCPSGAAVRKMPSWIPFDERAECKGLVLEVVAIVRAGTALFRFESLECAAAIAPVSFWNLIRRRRKKAPLWRTDVSV
jgi:ferredoxin